MSESNLYFYLSNIINIHLFINTDQSRNNTKDSDRLSLRASVFDVLEKTLQVRRNLQNNHIHTRNSIKYILEKCLIFLET